MFAVSVLFFGMALFIIGILVVSFVRYFRDEKREQRGEAQLQQKYSSSLTGKGVEFVETLCSDLQDIKKARKAVEEEKRAKYVFHDGGDDMDDIYSFSMKNDDTE